MSSIESYNDVISKYQPELNTSRNIMSKYEKAKIIGVRMEQLARGSKPMIELDKTMVDIREIAMAELAERKMPLMIVRVMFNGIKEYWRLEDMIIPDY